MNPEEEYPELEMSDGEAVTTFVWDVLFLSPVELLYVVISMSVIAFYGLSIYYVYKKIQKKFSWHPKKELKKKSTNIVETIEENKYQR